MSPLPLMSAPSSDPFRAIRMSAIDPHETLTMPLSPMPEPVMDTSAFGASAPPTVESPRQQEENELTQKHQTRMAEQSAKPEGFGHKLLHGLNVFRNIAETSLVPGVAMADPTSELHKNLVDENRMGRLADLQKQDQDEQKQFADERLQNQQTREAAARADALENPAEKGKPYTIQTDEGMLQWNPDEGSWTPITVNGDVAMPFAKPSSTRANAFQHVSGTSQGKQVFANYDPSKGVFTDLQGNVLTDFHPTDKAMQGVLGQYAPIKLLQGLLNTAYNDNPALLPYVGKLAQQIMGHYGAGPGVEQAFGTAPEGQPHSDTGNPIGLKMPEAPTGQTRSRGQFASDVIPAINDAQGQISKLGDQLGPLAGRYNELATSKIGAFGPQFTDLQTTLHNIATAWMRLHANSEGAREDFINQLRAAQSPENLVAALHAINKQAQDYVATGKGRPDTIGAGAPVLESLGTTNKPDGVYEMGGKQYRVKGGQVYAH